MLCLYSAIEAPLMGRLELCGFSVKLLTRSISVALAFIRPCLHMHSFIYLDDF